MRLDARAIVFDHFRSSWSLVSNSILRPPYNCCTPVLSRYLILAIPYSVYSVFYLGSRSRWFIVIRTTFYPNPFQGPALSLNGPSAKLITVTWSPVACTLLYSHHDGISGWERMLLVRLYCPRLLNDWGSDRLQRNTPIPIHNVSKHSNIYMQKQVWSTHWLFRTTYR